MSISNKFNLLLSNKVENVSGNFPNAQIRYRNNNQTDTFELTQNSQVAFKGRTKAPIEMLGKATKSKSFWAILGAATASTALAIWSNLTNNGKKESDLTVEEIQKLIQDNIPIENPNTATGTTEEEIIDIKPEREVEASTTETVEAPKKRRSIPPKTIKLEGDKQPDTKNAVKTLRRQQAQDVETIKELAEEGFTVGEIEEYTGIKSQQIRRIAKKENIKFVDARTQKKQVFHKKVKKRFQLKKYLNINQKIL